MSKDQKQGGVQYTDGRLKRAAKEEDGYTDGTSSKEARKALDAQADAELNGAEIKTKKLDIYVDESGNLRGNPVPRQW
jgi:hypothetical protein